MTTGTGWIAGYALVPIVIIGAAAAQPSAQSRRLLASVDEWTAAVAQHQPGTTADSTVRIAMWPWSRLGPVLRHQKAQAQSLLLLRAAVMYLDVALHIEARGRPEYPTEGQRIESADARVLDIHHLDPHLWWGRWLVTTVLERRTLRPEEHDIGVAWFRTVTAIYAGALNLADLEPHLETALRLLPDDAAILFDAGCNAETLASPLFQAAMRAPLPTDLDVTRAPFPRLKPKPPVDPSRHLQAAERHFRASLAADPSGAETRLRLGRVLARRGRTTEAIEQLEAATRVATDRVVRYYAWLFLGGALTDAQRYDDALKALGEATSIFAAASAPHLGMSRVHTERGDLERSRAALEPLLLADPDGMGSSELPWRYERCAGRDGEEIYTAFVRRMRETF